MSAGGQNSSPPTVLLRDVGVRFGRRRSARTALDGLNLTLAVGVHGLLGPNGAGKTTLMRVLATVLPPTSGSVTLLGHDAQKERQRLQVRRKLGYLPQSFGSYPRFTVREFVEYFAWLKEVPSSRAPAAVAEAIDRVGLQQRAESKMKSLSGGMLRRAALAQAIVNDPEILLLDEPTAGLDPEQRVTFRRLVREIGMETTVLVSTHIVEDIASICNDVILVNEGSVVLRGTSTDLEMLGHSVGTPSADISALELGYTAALNGDMAPGGVRP